MIPLTPTEDIRAARHQLAAKFNNDLDRIVADLRRQQTESSAEFITLPGRPLKCMTNKPLPGSGETAVLNLGNQSSPPGDR